MTSGPPPGWYPDPSGAPGVRWWNGSVWTDLAPAAAQPEPAQRLHKWRPHGWWQWAIVTVLVLLVAASGVYFGAVRSTPSSDRSAGSSPTTLPPVGNGYLATGSDFVDFIQWNDNAGSLSGTAQTVNTTGQPPNLSTTSDTLRVTGTLNGSAISLSFDGGPQAFGTISGGSFTLDFPQPDGTLAPITFQSATAAQYNRAVSNLVQRVNQANQTAANAEALQQEEQAIANDAVAVSNAIATLSQDESSTTGYVQAIPKDLQTEASDVATTHQAEQQVVAESATSSQSQTCSDASGVAGDAAGVGGDAAAVEGDAAAVEASLSTINGLRADIANLNSSFAQLQSDEDALPGYIPPNTPSQNDVSTALAAANSAVQSAVSTTNGYIDQANADVTTAYQYVAEAFQAGKCGSPPTAPSPVQTIS